MDIHINHLMFNAHVEHNLQKLIKEFADCSICGICCKDCKVPLFDYEIKKIADFLKIKTKKFKKMYIVKSTTSITKQGFKQPCPFLKNNKCDIYSVRPLACRSFPFAVDSERDLVFVSNIEVCYASTHFINGFEEFCIKYFPEYIKHQRMIKPENDIDKHPNKCINQVIYLPLVLQYIIWLNFKPEFKSKYDDLLKITDNIRKECGLTQFSEIFGSTFTQNKPKGLNKINSGIEKNGISRSNGFHNHA